MEEGTVSVAGASAEAPQKTHHGAHVGAGVLARAEDEYLDMWVLDGNLLSRDDPARLRQLPLGIRCQAGPL